MLRLLFSVLSNIGVVLYVILKYKTTPILDRTENNNLKIQNNTNIGQNGK
jgi:F0F1-type ATP synthase membrane subunit b/b'